MSVLSFARRNVENIYSEGGLPADFSAHNVKKQSKKPLTVKFFDCQNDMLRILAQRVGFDVSMVVIKLAGGQEFVKKQADMINKILCDVMADELRITDQVYDKTSTADEYNIVLPGTTMQNAHIVVDKINQAVKKRAPELFSQSRYSFSVESLYTPQAA